MKQSIKVLSIKLWIKNTWIKRMVYKWIIKSFLLLLFSVRIITGGSICPQRLHISQILSICNIVNFNMGIKWMNIGYLFCFCYHENKNACHCIKICNHRCVHSLNLGLPFIMNIVLKFKKYVDFNFIKEWQEIVNAILLTC